MTWEDILIAVISCILGIVIPLLITSWKNKRRVSLWFQSKECYKLFHNDIKKLNINILYQNMPLENNLILFKGIIKNNGHSAIRKEDIEKELQIRAGKIYKWREVRIIQSPDSVSVDIGNDYDYIKFKWGLLQKGEYIEFEALIEVCDTGGKVSDFSDSIYFKHGIANLNGIDKGDIVPSNNVLALRTMAYFIMTLGIILIIMACFKSEYHLQHIAVNNTQDTVNLLISPSDTHSLLEIKSGSDRENITTENFAGKYRILHVNMQQTPYTSMKLFRQGVSFIMLSVFPLLASLIINIRSVKRIKSKQC